MAAHGLFGTSCITALTVQSTLGVQSSHAVDAAVVKKTLECLAADLPPAGIKIGMLANAVAVEVVAQFLEGLKGKVPLVLDPVIRSSSGAHLLDMAGIAVMRRRLLPLVDWLTPNIGELSALAGITVDGPEQMEQAAAALRVRWPRLNVAATGGHLEQPDDLVMRADGGVEWMRGERVESRSTHGTGCAFSTSLLCGLVSGLEPGDAARAAKRYVAEAIRRAEPRGGGNGPMELYWPLHQTSTA